VPIEIERKFLVSGTDWRTSKGVHYTQGYLNKDKEKTVRVRVTPTQAFLCVKGFREGISRMEFEYEIPMEDAQYMLKLCTGALIQKVRHPVMYKGLEWEVDEFFGDNEGLIVAEVELESEDQIFEKPPWLGQEVTHDSRYTNSSLARHPFNQWNKNI
jgi:CYTH domain-containing protein